MVSNIIDIQDEPNLIIITNTLADQHGCRSRHIASPYSFRAILVHQGNRLSDIVSAHFDLLHVLTSEDYSSQWPMNAHFTIRDTVFKSIDGNDVVIDRNYFRFICRLMMGWKACKPSS